MDYENTVVVQGFFNKIWSGIKKAANAVVDTAKKVTNTIADTATNIAYEIKSTVEKLPNQLLDIIKTGAEYGVTYTIEGIKYVVEKVGPTVVDANTLLVKVVAFESSDQANTDTDTPDLLLGGSNNSDTLTGAAGEDLLSGDNGNDRLEGQADTDLLFGGAGADTIYGGADEDYIEGGDGSDTVYGGSASDIIEGGDGDDVIYGGNALADATDDEDLITAGAGNDTVFGNGGDDILAGEQGHDHIDGGLGDDIIFGGSGNDTLYGNDGNDHLIAGSGNDHLYGGAGLDTFVFGHSDTPISSVEVGVGTFSSLGSTVAILPFLLNSGALVDVIYDFEVGTDKLDFSHLSGSIWRGDASNVGAPGIFTKRVAEGTLVQVETDGNGFADYNILLVGVSSLHSSDIIV